MEGCYWSFGSKENYMSSTWCVTWLHEGVRNGAGKELLEILTVNEIKFA